MKKHKIACIIGTRPEAVKMAPVILELKKRSGVEVSVISTGQHKDILRPILDAFSIVPDFDLDLMKPGQRLEEISSATLISLPPVLEALKPDWVLVQGDTTTAFISALCAFYKKIKVGHIEAGLRSYSKAEPYPEEINRCFISKLADLHFAPTELNKRALLAEGIKEEAIVVIGNTVIDALFMQLDRLGDKFLDPDLSTFFSSNTRKILVTAHRRENFGQGMINICKAVKQILNSFSDVEILIPSHPNPEAKIPINNILGQNPKVKIVQPLGYFDFIQAMNKSYLILTDSGRVQEEAPSLGKPVLVLRNLTERPEGVETGVLRLVGTDPETIFKETSLLLSDEREYQKMVKGFNPYGNGGAGLVIAETLLKGNFQNKLMLGNAY